MEEYFGWYSEGEEKTRGSYYYRNMTGEKVVITHLTTTDNDDSGWLDAVFVDKVSDKIGTCHPPRKRAKY